MRSVIALRAAEVMPSRESALERIGVPAGVEVAPRVEALVSDALGRLVALAEPRGVMQRITAPEFLDVFGGEGRNAPATPLDEIVPRAEALALFVATIGRNVSRTIKTLFADGDPALAVMLDACASEMANLTVNELARRFALTVRDGARVLPYSPGYCGWHVSGQRALFRSLEPADIEVSLEPSCLMTPLKSVSGVLVAGDAHTHRFRPRWAFCDECVGRDCGPRMASVR